MVVVGTNFVVFILYLYSVYYFSCIYICGQLLHAFSLTVLCHCVSTFILKMFIITIISYHLMQGFYNYIPETDHICRVSNIAATQQLQFVVHVMLFPVLNVLQVYISTSQSMCAVPSLAVFCSSLILYFLGMLFRCVLNDFEIVPVAHVITGITFHMHCISVVRSYTLKCYGLSF